MQPEILPRVIFSPGVLAMQLARGLTAVGVEVTLYSPGNMAVGDGVRQVTADLSGFEIELAARGDDYLDLLRKHPLVFISLARAVQAELVATAYSDANAGVTDLVHIYTNEEELALPFARFCKKPVVFTHHDPFNFAARYRHSFPRYFYENWISMSLAQRRRMPTDTNWVGNVYHGLAADAFKPRYEHGEYLAYLGRIVEPKGVHLAIAAVKKYNETAKRPMKLKIAGKHYGGEKDKYWQEQVEPQIDGKTIEYAGFIRDLSEKERFLQGASALLVPSTFDEPFGMVMIEALACGTPVIGLDSGAIPEVVRNAQTGFVAKKSMQEVHIPNFGKVQQRVDPEPTVRSLAEAVGRITEIDRHACRDDFEKRFTLDRMVARHLDVYRSLVQ
jgi:glycosyltransferase involved in cell wall biosynthesis